MDNSKQNTFLGWTISFGAYGIAVPIIIKYQTWSEYCATRGWNPEKLKKNK